MNAVLKPAEKPALPVQYEHACRALAECQTLDEAKHWDNKADALLAWAKIYRDDRAGKEARRLKLHAYRRMGEIAREVQPTKGRGPGVTGGRRPGHVALLRGAGLGASQATQASYLSAMERPKFDAIVASDRPPAPSSVLPRVSGNHSKAFATLVDSRNGFSLVSMHAFIAAHSAVDLANGLSMPEKQRVADLSRGLMLWMKDLHVTCMAATWTGEQ